MVVFSSVPDKNIERHYITTDNQKKILNFLKADENKNRWVTAFEIAKFCDMPTKGTQVEVRNNIKLLIIHKFCPIVSGAKGFLYTDDRRLIMRYMNENEKRIDGLEMRNKFLKKIYLRMPIMGEEKYDWDKFE